MMESRADHLYALPTRASLISDRPLQIFKHTFNFFQKYGHNPQEVRLQVAFGKGPDGFWTNCFPSNLVNHFSDDIKKFGKVLRIIKWTMPILGLVVGSPINFLCPLAMKTRSCACRARSKPLTLTNQTEHRAKSSSSLSRSCYACFSLVKDLGIRWYTL